MTPTEVFGVHTGSPSTVQRSKVKMTNYNNAGIDYRRQNFSFFFSLFTSQVDAHKGPVVQKQTAQQKPIHGTQMT